MKILAAISSPAQDEVIERILRARGEWDPPWLRAKPARGPPGDGGASSEAAFALGTRIHYEEGSEPGHPEEEVDQDGNLGDLGSEEAWAGPLEDMEVGAIQAPPRGGVFAEVHRTPMHLDILIQRNPFQYHRLMTEASSVSFASPTAKDARPRRAVPLTHRPTRLPIATRARGRGLLRRRPGVRGFRIKRKPPARSRGASLTTFARMALTSWRHRLILKRLDAAGPARRSGAGPPRGPDVILAEPQPPRGLGVGLRLPIWRWGGFVRCGDSLA